MKTGEQARNGGALTTQTTKGLNAGENCTGDGKNIEGLLK